MTVVFGLDPNKRHDALHGQWILAENLFRQYLL